MKEIRGLWAGRIYGTNTGNFFLKFSEKEYSKLKGTIRILDSEHGTYLYNVEGELKEKLILKGTPAEKIEGTNLGTITIKARLDSDESFHGEWESSIGTGGPFAAFPHADADQNQKIEEKKPGPEQIFSHSIEIGAISLSGTDIKDMIDYVKNDFNASRAIVTYSTGIGEITKYADDFLDECATIGTITYLKLQIQEQEDHGINKIVVIELRRHGFSEVRA